MFILGLKWHQLNLYHAFVGNKANERVTGTLLLIVLFLASLSLSGAIEVTIATMSKEYCLSTEEVYTVGFVPSYLLPDKRPNALDPFLEPLVADFENSFVEGNIFVMSIIMVPINNKEV